MLAPGTALGRVLGSGPGLGAMVLDLALGMALGRMLDLAPGMAPGMVLARELGLGNGMKAASWGPSLMPRTFPKGHSLWGGGRQRAHTKERCMGECTHGTCSTAQPMAVAST